MTTLRAPSGTDQERLTRLINQWAAKRARNILRTTYYDSRNNLRDLGISLPPSMRTIEVVLGWPAKVVDALVALIVFDGLTLPDDDPLGVAAMLARADLETLLPQAFTSSAVHSTSFLTVAPGDTSRGEPEVLFLPKSAHAATGIWDGRLQALSEGLSVTATDPETRMPTEFVWYSREHVTTFRRDQGRWTSDTQANRTGRVWMEPLTYAPNLDRPFGRSRISRGVMALTDAALRVLARSEAHAEFFASPQRYALGAEKEAFGDASDRWNAVMSRLLVVTKDEDGDVPTMGQFAQMSMSPHFEHLRTLASLMAGETSLSLDRFGIVQDNPASAEAIFATERPLAMLARVAGRGYGQRIVRAATTGVMIRDNLREPPGELLTARARFVNPDMVSPASAADALAKQVGALPWLAESTVMLEKLGYDEHEIQRLLSDKRRAEGSRVLDALRAAADDGDQS